MKYLGESTPLSVKPFQVEDSVPTEDESEWAIRRLMNNRSGGPSGMRTDHIKMWLEEERKAEAAAETAVEDEAETTIEPEY